MKRYVISYLIIGLLVVAVHVAFYEIRSIFIYFRDRRRYGRQSRFKY